jgi:type I pullulanase
VVLSLLLFVVLAPLELAARPQIAPAYRIETFDRTPMVVNKDKSKLLTVMGLYGDGRTELSQDQVEWAVSDASIAEVLPNGKIVGKRAGSVRVTATVAGQKTVNEQFVVEEKPIKIFFKAPNHWRQAHVWIWYLRGNAHPSGLDENGQPLGVVNPPGFGSWPGPQMAAVPGASGWYQFDVPRYDSRELKGENLKQQPFWIIFSNPVTGEKSWDYLRDGGCFIAEGSKEGKLQGEWYTGGVCPEAGSEPLSVQAVPAGGKMYDRDLSVQIQARGAELTDFKYSISSPNEDAAESDLVTSPLTGTTVKITKNSDSDDDTRLCLYAKNRAGAQLKQCYLYEKAGELPTADRLGATYYRDRTTFMIWSPRHRDVRLWLDGRLMPMDFIGSRVAGYKDVYALTVPGDHHLKPYHFLIGGQIARDPYAKMVTPGTDFSIVMDMSQTMPKEGWVLPPPLLKREDAIIYEMSVRDFTIHASSGVADAKKGTFGGMVTRGSRLTLEDGSVDDRVRTGIDHLLELGVTHVQLMPIYDYGTCSAKDPHNSPQCYNWGYDPENFNVPEERYSSVGPYNYAERARELKTMINELHKAGIRVIMDVVYNHTWTRGWRTQDEGERYLSPITDQYFLKDGAGKIIDLTGTGNTIDSAHPMVRRYIRDSLEYWAKEYQIDGFRFDLAGVFGKDEMREWTVYLEEALPHRTFLFYGEPWVANYDLDKNSSHIRLSNIGSMFYGGDGKIAHFGGFNDVFRNAMKGENNNGEGGGFAFNSSDKIWTVVQGVRGSVTYPDGTVKSSESIFAADPEQSINYVSAHDNLTLWDKIDLWAERSGVKENEYKKRIQMYANGVILTSQGIPFLHGGEELARTKYRNHNSYNSPDRYNWIDWKRKRDFGGVFDYYKKAIHLRRNHGGLRLPTRDEINQSMEMVTVDQARNYFVVHIKPSQNNKNEYLAIYNSGAPIGYALPDGQWKLLMGDGRAYAPEEEKTLQGVVRADGTSVTLLYRSF